MCLTLCDPVDYTVHGILQARILEWVAFPFSRGSSQPRDRTQVSCIAGGFFTSWAIRELPNIIMSYNATINVDYYLCNSIFITAWIYSVQYYTLAKKKKISTRELPCQSPVSYNITEWHLHIWSVIDHQRNCICKSLNSPWWVSKEMSPLCQPTFPRQQAISLPLLCTCCFNCYTWTKDGVLIAFMQFWVYSCSVKWTKI